MAFLDELEKRLDLPPARKRQVMQELRAHWAEIKQELVLSGMCDTEASAEAERRLGDSQEVAGLLASVHNSASWRSALLAAVPFVVTAILTLHPPALYTYQHFIACMAWCAVSVAFSVREIAAGRRPIWLATWLASGLLAGQHVLWMVGISLGFDGSHSLLASAAIDLVICAVLLAGVWSIRRWRVIALVLVALSLIPALPSSWFSMLILEMLFAFAFFARHRYGSTAQAALFLFAMVCLPVSGNIASVANAVVLPILGCAVVLFARTPDWRRKMGLMVAGGSLKALALAAAFAIVAVSDKTTVATHQASYLLSVGISFLPPVVVAVAAPMIYEKRRQRAEG